MTNPAQGEAPYPRHQPAASSGTRTMTDLLALADPERTLVNWLLRQQSASLADILAHTQVEPAALQVMLDSLVAEGFLTVNQEADPAVFKPNLISRQPRTMPDKLWKAVE